jgi:hypothetical protein
LIGLTGKAGHGKSTVADMICDMVTGADQYSLAGPLKRMALRIDPIIDFEVECCDSGTFVHLSELVETNGWDVAKQDPDVRRFLQRLGTEGVRGTFGDDAWVDLMRKWWHEQSTAKYGVIPDVRFPNELAAVDVSIEVYRPDGVHLTGENARHRSETATLPADHVILNRGNLDELRLAVGFCLLGLGIPIQL